MYKETQAILLSFWSKYFCDFWLNENIFMFFYFIFISFMTKWMAICLLGFLFYLFIIFFCQSNFILYRIESSLDRNGNNIVNICIKTSESLAFCNLVLIAHIPSVYDVMIVTYSNGFSFLFVKLYVIRWMLQILSITIFRIVLCYFDFRMVFSFYVDIVCQLVEYRICFFCT